MQQTHQATVATFSTPIPPPSSSGGSTAEAPPKQIALAMDKLVQAERIIADIRIGADRVLEALFISANQPHQDNKPLQVFLNENACIHASAFSRASIPWYAILVPLLRFDRFSVLQLGF
jgi:mediator of RNA polymerase II transcription subunit 27